MKNILKAIRNMINGVYNYVDNIIAKATNVAYVYTELIKEQTVAIDVDSSEEYDYESLDGNLYLEQGKVYAVTLNGKTYTCTAWYLEYWESVCLGNGSVIGQEGGDDAPFLIDSYPDGSIYLEVASSGEYTISISSVEEGTRTLDKKYLPEDAKPDWNQNDPTAPDYVKNRTHWVEEGVLLERQTFEFAEIAELGGMYACMLPSVLNIPDGKTTVYWDGVKYECLAKNGFVGNAVISGGENSGEPFVISSGYGVVIAVDDTSTSHEIRIIGEMAVKIAKKFLPDHVAFTAVVNVAKTEDGVYTIDKTYDELNEVLLTGGDAILWDHQRVFRVEVCAGTITFARTDYDPVGNAIYQSAFYVRRDNSVEYISYKLTGFTGEKL